MNRSIITIKGLEVFTRIGVPDEERTNPQRLLVDIDVTPHIEFSAMADDLSNSIDYHALCLEVARLASRGERRLIETLANEIADLALVQPGAIRVRVSLRKHILPQTEWVGVSIEKEQPASG